MSVRSARGGLAAGFLAEEDRFVEVDVTRLNVAGGRAGVFVVPNEGPLDLTGRIASWDAN